MKKINHIFVDESNHLENDNSPIMVVGFIKVPDNAYIELKQKIKELKYNHTIPYEIKWNTVSNTKVNFYEELIDLFFDSSLSFRSVLVKYKQQLDHDQFNQGSHDNFYYKMIYYLLSNPWFNPHEELYRVFIDIKDTRGREKLAKINQVFNNKHFKESPFIHFQHIQSHESVFIQLADLFIGAIGYKSKGLYKNSQGNKVKIHPYNPQKDDLPDFYANYYEKFVHLITENKIKSVILKKKEQIEFIGLSLSLKIE